MQATDRKSTKRAVNTNQVTDPNQKVANRCMYCGRHDHEADTGYVDQPFCSSFCSINGKIRDVENYRATSLRKIETYSYSFGRCRPLGEVARLADFLTLVFRLVRLKEVKNNLMDLQDASRRLPEEVYLEGSKMVSLEEAGLVVHNLCQLVGEGQGPETEGVTGLLSIEVAGYLNSLMDKWTVTCESAISPGFKDMAYTERLSSFFVILLGTWIDPTQRLPFVTEELSQARCIANHMRMLAKGEGHLEDMVQREDDKQYGWCLSMESTRVVETELEIWLDCRTQITTVILTGHEMLDGFAFQRLHRFITVDCGISFPYLLLFEIRCQPRSIIYTVSEEQDISRLSKDRGKLLISRIVPPTSQTSLLGVAHADQSSSRSYLTFKYRVCHHDLYVSCTADVRDSEMYSRLREMVSDLASLWGLNEKECQELKIFSLAVRYVPMQMSTAPFIIENSFDRVYMLLDPWTPPDRNYPHTALNKHIDYTAEEMLRLFTDTRGLESKAWTTGRGPAFLLLRTFGVLQGTVASTLLKSISSSPLLLRGRRGMHLEVKRVDLRFGDSSVESLYNVNGYKTVVPQLGSPVELLSSRLGLTRMVENSVPWGSIELLYFELEQDECC